MIPNGITSTAYKSRSLLVLLLLVTCLLPLVSVGHFSWHDQQRIGQIALGVLVLIACCFVRSIPQVGRVAVVGVALLFAWGVVSALRQEYWLWSLAEVSLFVLNFGISLFVCSNFQQARALSEQLLLMSLRLICAVLVIRFLVYASVELYSPSKGFHPWNVVDGFSNPRFQGHFFTLALPAIFFAGSLSYWRTRLFDAFLCVVCSALVFIAGTRGTLLAWCCVSIFFLAANSKWRPVVIRFLMIVLLGYVIASVFIYLVGHESGWRFSAGHTLIGLSARELLWWEAIRKIAENPIFGVGPMGFASLGSLVGNHPHQVLLQFAVEWGVPATILGMYLLGRFFWFCHSVIDSDMDGVPDWAAFGFYFAVLAANVQAMVDGVYVMPYSQTWLAIVSGALIGVCAVDRCAVSISGKRAMIAIMLAAQTCLLFVVCRDALDLSYDQKQALPRFWLNGDISR